MTEQTDRLGLITFKMRGDVAVIRIDDGKANAISHELIGEFIDALDKARADAKAVVVVGREGRFSAGFDLKTMGAGPTQARDLLKAGAQVGHALYLLPIPVVIGCTGHALAMGAILLFCADVRIGAEGAYKIGMNEVAIGMPLPRFAVELARDRLSPRQLTAATNLAQIYDPAGAVEAGYLDRVAPLADVEAEAIATATELASKLDPRAFRMTRNHLRAAHADQVLRALDQDTDDLS